MAKKDERRSGMSLWPQFIDELKQRNSIQDVVSRRVALKRAGSNLTGLCPFHSEKTPSFVVFPRTETFYCFGCGAGGDVITFVMKDEGLDYRSAVERLASQCGLPMPEQERVRDPDSVSRERVIDVNKDAARFFHDRLFAPEGARALGYLMKRGLQISTIKHFGLGYSPQGQNELWEFLREKGYTLRESQAAFLVKTASNRPYDIFRGRVMFPIIDTGGNVVAFGGRTLGDDKPKYINSSETPAFRKSRHLFALNYAAKNCKDGLLMCEGYMDVITLHQAGFTNAVATLGTAVNDDHARIIARYTNNVSLCYDSDDAGRKATDRAIEALSKAGISVRVIDLGASKDPDEFIKANGRDAFALKLKKSEGRIDYRIREIMSRYKDDDADDRQRRMQELVELAASLPDKPLREIYCRRIAELTGLSADGIIQSAEMRHRRMENKARRDKARSDITTDEGYRNRANPDKVRFSAVAHVEERILGILFVNPALGPYAVGKLKPGEFNTSFCREVYEEFLPNFERGEVPDISAGGDLDERKVAEISRYIASRAMLSDNGQDVLQAQIELLKEHNTRRAADALTASDMDALGEYLDMLRNRKNDKTNKKCK